MGKRVSVTERVLEDGPGDRTGEATTNGMRGENGGRRSMKNSRRAEGRAAEHEADNLVEATFLLDAESMEILLRHQKRDGESKSAPVREAIPWFRAKPGNRMELLVDATSSLISRAVVKERGASRATMAALVAPVFTFVGSLFVGGALSLAQGGLSGGDGMGIGILATLGVTLILLGIGIALTFMVTHLLDLPSKAAAVDADVPQETSDRQSAGTLWPARPKRSPRPRRSVRR